MKTIMNHYRSEWPVIANLKYLALGLFLTGILSLFTTQTTYAQNGQQGSGAVVNCPAACPGQCWFVFDIQKTAPDSNGCFDAKLNMLFGSTNPDCKADVDRSVGDQGTVKYTLCDGTACGLSKKNFPDGSPIPYGPNDSVPAGKEALSKPCFDAITITPAGGGVGGGAYNFKNIKDISADFQMHVFCFCNGDTIRDTVPFEYNVEVQNENPDGDGHDPDKPNGDDGKNGGNIAAPGSGSGTAIQKATTIYNSMGYNIEKIYPNPIGQVFNVKLSVDEEESFEFTLIDDGGNIWHNHNERLSAGENDIAVHLETELEPGKIYYLLIHRENGHFSTTRLLAQ